MSVGRQPSWKTRRRRLDQFISLLAQIPPKSSTVSWNKLLTSLKFRIKQQKTKSNFDGSNILFLWFNKKTFPYKMVTTIWMYKSRYIAIHVRSLKHRLMQCHINFFMMWMRERNVGERGGCFVKQLPHEQKFKMEITISPLYNLAFRIYQEFIWAKTLGPNDMEWSPGQESRVLAQPLPATWTTRPEKRNGIAGIHELPRREPQGGIRPVPNQRRKKKLAAGH